MSRPNECILMTIDEFKKEHEAACNPGFKHGADMVLKLAKMVMPPNHYEAIETSVRARANYKEGKKQEDETAAWAAKKQKEYGHER
jgi:hypothetical protein